MSYDPRLFAIAERFPTLRRALPKFTKLRADYQFLDLEGLDESSMTASSGEFHAIAFVCNLHNNRAAWKCGTFDFFKAWETWDAEHRAAFLAWAQEGWIP